MPPPVGRGCSGVARDDAFSSMMTDQAESGKTGSLAAPGFEAVDFGVGVGTIAAIRPGSPSTIVAMTARRIAITGATRGLGRALVEQFIDQGHTVFGCGRSEEHIAGLRQTYGKPHGFLVCDVRDPAAVAAWADSVFDAGGPPDVLINNAALINDPAPLWEVPPEEFADLLAVNIQGTFHTIQAFVPAMIQARRGVVVNFSSGWGRSTSPEVGPYCATKYAIEGLSQALAQELPAPLAAVPLNPGVIDTDMLRQAWGDGASSYPDPAAWAQRAAPQILGFSRRDNGQSASIH